MLSLSILSASLCFSLAAPCPPEDVVSTVDCSSNTAVVEWQAAAGADSYFVYAIGMEEHVTGCETDSTSCVVPDLMCGFTYNVSVISVSDQCNNTESPVTQMHSGEAGRIEFDHKHAESTAVK